MALAVALASAARVALDEILAGDAAEDLLVDLVVDLGNGERRRLGAQAREGVVPGEEQALGVVPPARDREVPRKIEAVALDAGSRQGGEEAFHVSAPRLLHRIARCRAVAVGDEVGVGRDERSGRVLHPPKRDDVARPVPKVHRRMEQDGPGCLAASIRIDLRPEEVMGEGVRVDEHDRRVTVERTRDVGDRHRAGHAEIDPRHPEHDRRARAEAVAAVVVGGIDRLLRGVPRHRRQGEVHPPPGARRRVCLGEVVVRERMEAHARIEEVARAGAVGAAERPGATGGAGRVALLARIDGPVAAERRQRRARRGRGGRRATARVRATSARSHVDAARLSTGVRGLHDAPLALP